MTSAKLGRVAVVDDEVNIRKTVGFALSRQGYQVTTHENGFVAWQEMQQSLPDIAILDILMPRMDGLELCRRLRGLSESLPILFLSSRDEEFDRVLGLELGADDYLCKPFSMRELSARVKVLFRRLAISREDSGPNKIEQCVRVGRLELDLARYTATWSEQPIGFTVTEFTLLLALARRPGHVKTRQQLMQEGYPYDAYVSERTIDSHIKRIRKKLCVFDENFDSLETVYGLGYRFRDG